MRSGLFRIVLFSTLFLLACPRPAAAAPNPHNNRLCLLCHGETPRFGVDTRETVTFRTGSWDDPQLCYHCHGKKENLHPVLVEPSLKKLRTRTPVFLPLGASPGLEGKVVCTTCHFIHASDSGHALLRGFPGSQEPDRFTSWQSLCKDCHGDGLESRSPHSGDDRACTFCHQTRPRENSPADVAPRGIELCNFCHGGLQDGHFGRVNPFGQITACNDCHDPHLGPKHPGRLKDSYLKAARLDVTISPHYRRALCFSCHDEGEGYPLLFNDPVFLCNRCHGQEGVIGDVHPLGKVPANMTIPDGWPLSGGLITCLTCHRAGHEDDLGRWKFLRGGPYSQRNDFCRSCHNPQSVAGTDPHGNINEGAGCQLCHVERPVPGKDTIDSVRFVADPNLLCLRCHGENPHPAGVEHTLILSDEAAALISTELPLYQGRKIVCATCHNPHIKESSRHKLRSGSFGFMICLACHSY